MAAPNNAIIAHKRVLLTTKTDKLVVLPQAFVDIDSLYAVIYRVEIRPTVKAIKIYVYICVNTFVR